MGGGGGGGGGGLDDNLGMVHRCVLCGGVVELRHSKSHRGGACFEVGTVRRLAIALERCLLSKFESPRLVSWFRMNRFRMRSVNRVSLRGGGVQRARVPAAHETSRRSHQRCRRRHAGVRERSMRPRATRRGANSRPAHAPSLAPASFPSLERVQRMRLLRPGTACPHRPHG